MFRAFLTAYPWDLLDDEFGVRLDQLHGEIGATGLTVWAASPPTTQVRGRDVEPRIVRTRGGLLFHPEEHHYAGTRVKPIVSSWVKSKRPLQRLATACSERGMELRVKVSAALTGRLAQKHPEAACKNLFGSVSHESVCLFNPDVETYLASLVADLSSNHDISGVSISDLFVGWSEAYDPSLLAGLALGDTMRSLLFICFCESCHQRAAAAGVDVEIALRATRVLAQQTIDRGAASDVKFATILSDHPPLGEYHRWRIEELSSVLKRLSVACQACKKEVIWDRGRERCETDQSELLVTDSTSVTTRVDGPDQLAEAMCAQAMRNEIRVPAHATVGPHGRELVKLVSRAVELGFSGVEFDGYGLMSETAFPSIKQAIRFARRSTEV